MTDQQQTEKPSELTDAEFVFVRRMLPHFMAGKSAVEAAAAVLEDDSRLLSAVAHLPKVDDRPDFCVAGLREELTRSIYAGCREATHA